MTDPSPAAPVLLTEEARCWDGRLRHYRLPGLADARGVLHALSFAQLPLQPRRLFWIGDVPPGTVRGGHAHRSATQLLLRLAGEIHVECQHGGECHTLVLDAEHPGLLIAPGVWAQQTYLGEAPLLLVLSDAEFDPASYIHERNS